MNDTLTDVAGVEVGHSTDAENGTGCTVVLVRGGAVGGVDVRGAAPGTRETDLLRAENSVDRVHGIVLSGGSAYGLSTASGVMRYLEGQGVGHRVGPHIIPIVPAAILFDLGIGSSGVRPGEAQGLAAAEAASTKAVAQGSVGAGTGATVGKALGRGAAMKGGLGSASLDMGSGVVLSALVAVNAVGLIMADTWLVRSPIWIPTMLVLVPTVVAFGLCLALWISVRARSFMEAQQLAGVVVVPFVALMISQIFGVIVLNLAVALIAAVVLGAISVLIVNRIAPRFSREEIVRTLR